MIKHVGLFNAKKVTIVLHKMPTSEDAHMCLVIFDEKLPSPYYQRLKEVLMSETGQASKNLADALENISLQDGRNLARLLFAEGHLKKVPAKDVFATPYGYDSPNKMRLSELNDYVEKIEEGGEALDKLKEFDENKGMHWKERKERAIRNKSQGDLTKKQEVPPLPNVVEKSNTLQQNDLVATSSLLKKQVFDELKNNGEKLYSLANNLIEQAKMLNEKANELFPPEEKRKVSRPKGSVKKAKLHT